MVAKLAHANPMIVFRTIVHQPLLTRRLLNRQSRDQAFLKSRQSYIHHKLVILQREWLKLIKTVEQAVERSSFFEVPSMLYPSQVGDFAKGMAEADHQIHSVEIRLPSQKYFYIETQTALAILDEDNCMVVYSSIEVPEYAQTVIARCLNIPEHNVWVITRRVGGIFSGKAIKAMQSYKGGLCSVWDACSNKNALNVFSKYDRFDLYKSVIFVYKIVLDERKRKVFDVDHYQWFSSFCGSNDSVQESIVIIGMKRMKGVNLCGGTAHNDTGSGNGSPCRSVAVPICSICQGDNGNNGFPARAVTYAYGSNYAPTNHFTYTCHLIGRDIRIPKGTQNNPCKAAHRPAILISIYNTMEEELKASRDRLEEAVSVLAHQENEIKASRKQIEEAESKLGERVKELNASRDHLEEAKFCTSVGNDFMGTLCLSQMAITLLLPTTSSHAKETLPTVGYIYVNTLCVILIGTMGKRRDTKQYMKKVRWARGVDNYKPFEKCNYHEGRHCDLDFIRLSGLRQPFTNAGCLSFALLPPDIYPRHLQEFYAFYHFNPADLTLNFQMYGHNYTWTLENLGNVLGINSTGIRSTQMLQCANVDLELPANAAITSQQASVDPIGRMELMVNEMFDERTWNASEDPISDDEVIDDVAALPTHERLAYKTYQAIKCQRRESRSKFGVLKNFITRWATYMSCKDL
ncbi:abscisic aldehyde oxidase 3 [Artemisia annua]|uniref:Abscisic aldehyde oxidase 3 n=1 Tax=Artemisia annua TaxID=35608 RepID=A0A2U1PTG7_ARTAN|nr:abscisic aldehyde oxidase 3 [Artemisia annua]